MAKIRLDDLLVEQGYFADRDAALRAVIAREVRVDDVYVSSAALKVRPDADLFVKNIKKFVSRGGHKLQGALDHFQQDVTGFHCVDVGSSTGGFSDCLLQAGAASVACVDVNYGQLAWSLRQDPRVSVFERTNIRLASPESLGAPFDMVVCDLSFIGLAQLADVFANLCEDHGIVRSEAVRQRVVDEVTQALREVGFRVNGVVESSIKGAEGNVEYLVHATFLGSEA